MKLFFVLLLFSLYTIQKPDPTERTIALIRQNNVKELVKTFSSNVELTILTEEGVYSKDQAEGMLNSFFAKNPPISIKILHRVDSNPDLRYAVALLTTKNGNFRTSFSLRSNNGGCEVTELKIEDEKSR